MQWGRRTTSAVAAAVVLVIGLSAWGIAAIPDGDGVIHGCVSATGDVRVVDPDASQPSARSCRNTETAVDWNQRGQQGEPGDRGPAGPAGAAARAVCKSEDLLLCLPVRKDLEPRLTVEDHTILRGDGYRVELDHDIVEYREAGEQGPITRKLVDATTRRLVLTADLADASDEVLSWFDSVAQSSGTRLNPTLRLYDGESAVWAAHLSSALPDAVRIADGRVQVSLSVEDFDLVAP